MQKVDFYVIEFVNLPFKASGICIMLINASSTLKQMFSTFTRYPLVLLQFHFFYVWVFSHLSFILMQFAN